MNKNYFIFNGQQYGIGTVVNIYKEEEKQFGFNSMLVFDRYNDNEDLYYFRSFYSIWKVYKLKEADFNLYIEKITEAYIPIVDNQLEKKIEPKYIDGIISAWIWYILIMFFILFINGIGNKIIGWIFISVIFWSWRNRKMKGE